MRREHKAAILFCVMVLTAYILGYSIGYHDAAADAARIVNGRGY